MAYPITRTGDTILYSNQDNTTAQITVVIKSNCIEESSESFLVNPNSDWTYQLELDGEYHISIITDINVKDPDITTYIIIYYNNFLLSIITALENLFCGCGCNDCDDCIDYDIILESYYKVLTYYTLTANYYSGYINAVMSCVKCSILNEVHCIVNNEKYLGGHNNVSFLKKLLAYYYLAFYYAELEDDNEEEIKNKFKYNTIIKCLKGVDLDCIKQKIEDMGLFTINNEAYTNLPPSTVGDFSITKNNREDFIFESNMFTTRTVPEYADPENDPADAIRIDSLPTPGVIEYDGTPVTIGQIITMADIDADMLVYKAPDQDAIANLSFNFSVRDSGSGQFSS